MRMPDDIRENIVSRFLLVSQRSIILKEPLHIQRNFDEDTWSLSPTDCAEDNNATKVMVTLRLTRKRGSSIQRMETGGLI